MNNVKEYKSEFGYFVTFFLFGTTAYAAAEIYGDSGLSMPFFTVLICFLLLNFIILRVMFNTRYLIVDNNSLQIKMGWFDWPVIPISEITSIEKSYNPLSSPAPSLRRLKVRYSKNRWILISPKEREKLVKELQLINSEINVRI